MELISRQAAIDALRNYLVGKNAPCDGTLTCRLIENEVINKLPPIQPEIVRCKDCKHRDPEDKNAIAVTTFCGSCRDGMIGFVRMERGDRMKPSTYYQGNGHSKYGIYNRQKKEFQFGICEDTPMLAEARLFQKIGEDAKKWKFEVREINLTRYRICGYDETFTQAEALEETGFCKSCNLDCPNRGRG